MDGRTYHIEHDKLDFVIVEHLVLFLVIEGISGLLISLPIFFTISTFRIECDEYKIWKIRMFFKDYFELLSLVYVFTIGCLWMVLGMSELQELRCWKMLFLV